MVKKEVCRHCYESRKPHNGFWILTFEPDWKNRRLECITKIGVDAGPLCVFDLLPLNDCPYLLEHTVNVE
jgi:hypothetical protein